MLYEITIALAIAFGGGSASVTLDVSPTFLVDTTTPATAFRQVLGLPGANGDFGMALPHLIFVNSTAIDNYNAGWRDACERYGACDFEVVHHAEIAREEYLHTVQMRALGPAYFGAYALTMGEPFEPYNPRDAGQTFDWSSMWLPAPELANSCPLFRLSFDSSSGASAGVLPCYQLLELELR